MTKDKMQIAVAEACGWRDIHIDNTTLEGFPVLCGFDPRFSSYIIQAVPNYPDDLNAMNEAEKVLDAQPMDVRSLYLDYLAVSVGWADAINAADARFENHYLCVRATALQRCEAFLRALGKWKE